MTSATMVGDLECRVAPATSATSGIDRAAAAQLAQGATQSGLPMLGEAFPTGGRH